jgi:hypothetical protein
VSIHTPVGADDPLSQPDHPVDRGATSVTFTETTSTGATAVHVSMRSSGVQAKVSFHCRQRESLRSPCHQTDLRIGQRHAPFSEQRA